MTDSSVPAVPSARRVATLLGLLVALTVLGSSAVAVAIPDIKLALSLDTAGASWILASFSLAFSIATAFFGRLADLRGLRMPLRIGGLLFAGGSLLAAFAWSYPLLIAGRMVQGFGAGAVPVLAIGIVAARFSGPARGKAIGAVTAVVAIVSGSGPLIAGLITEVASWRAVLALPALALLLTEPVARIAPQQARNAGRLDFVGALLVGISVGGLALLVQAPTTGMAPLATLGLAVVTVGAALLVARHVRRYPSGFFPAVVVRDRLVMTSAAGGCTLLGSYLGGMLAIPIILAARGWRPLHIGVALVPAAVAGAVSSRIVGGRLADGGHRRLTIWLTALPAFGLVAAALTTAIPALLVAAMAPVAIGFAAGQVVYMDRLTSTVPDSTRGVALGIFHLVFFTGGAIGAALVGALAGRVGFPWALTCLAVLPLTGAVLAATIPEGSGQVAHRGDPDAV